MECENNILKPKQNKTENNLRWNVEFEKRKARKNGSVLKMENCLIEPIPEAWACMFFYSTESVVGS